LPLFIQVLHALDYAHRNRIVHRDIKPSNILVDRNERAMLTDFGIAIEIGAPRITRTGTFVGTPEYMSPEMIRDPLGSVDHRSDVYSAGIVLFEIMTGKVPFSGNSEFAVREQQVNREPPSPRALNSDMPKWLSRSILKALHKDPEQRFQGCAEFARALESQTTPPLDWGATLSSLRRPTPLALFFGILLLILMLGAYATWHGPAHDEGQARRSADALLAAAVQSYSTACMNSFEQQRKKRSQQIAQQAYETTSDPRFDRQARDFARQVAELEENAAQSSRLYGQNLAQLARFDLAVIQAIWSQNPAVRENSRLATTVSEDLDRYRTSAQAPDTTTMLKSCS
jgi:serine/threonine protein kinase